MLGRYSQWAYRFDGAKWQWLRLDARHKTKYRKLAEKRRWRREWDKENTPEEPLGAHPLRRGAFFNMAEMLNDTSEDNDVL